MTLSNYKFLKPLRHPSIIKKNVEKKFRLSDFPHVRWFLRETKEIEDELCETMHQKTIAGVPKSHQLRRYRSHTHQWQFCWFPLFLLRFAIQKTFFLINEKCEIYSNCRFIGSLCVLLVLIFSCQFRFLIVWATFIICYWSVGQFDGFCFDFSSFLVEFLLCGLRFSWIFLKNWRTLAVNRNFLIFLFSRSALKSSLFSFENRHSLNLFFSLNVLEFSLNALWFSLSLQMQSNFLCFQKFFWFSPLFNQFFDIFR